ncbi:hypothetical protein Y032_0195g1480 [Ancylostoma ceylanicum]|uniref:Uncharacterized protein n=1 Tax=Ancylostoma ceylanicum TaxID=53326 RepID=A0A016SPK4_9BILA|nr:hypothetical protein Y032_0195g1480 [Ancylostoma ceylanicum]
MQSSRSLRPPGGRHMNKVNEEIPEVRCDKRCGVAINRHRFHYHYRLHRLFVLGTSSRVRAMSSVWQRYLVMWQGNRYLRHSPDWSRSREELEPHVTSAPSDCSD